MSPEQVTAVAGEVFRVILLVLSLEAAYGFYRKGRKVFTAICLLVAASVVLSWAIRLSS
ncbi:hypothetical protein [Sinorhizobium meliloti]|uniref:hypothetical protein n=1 Tax=Rhizobium meliloti TaxID=382 RepID=UPI0013E3BDB0|nr:hypothetical protein [Sinorhizobium meliloti]